MIYPPEAPLLSISDPNRPTIAGEPALLRPQDGAPLSVLPCLQVRIEPGANLYVWVYVMVHGNTARMFDLTLEDCEFAPILASWRSCPEKLLVELFGWWPEVAAKRAARKARPIEFSLDGLDLTDE